MEVHGMSAPILAPAPAALVRMVFVPLLGLAAAGCGAFQPDEPVPHAFRVSGQAEGTVGELDISCSLTLDYDDTGRVWDSAGVQVKEVRMGGGAARTVLTSDGNGISLQPDLFSLEDRVRILAHDSVEILSPGSLGTDVPFYRGLGRLAGHLEGGGRAEGTWSCGPFDTRGDTVGVVEGTWQLAPRQD